MSDEEGGIRILHVDDEPEFLALTKAYLERDSLNFSIDAITSAEKGMELLSACKYDVVISDYRMPETDGLEFLQNIRQSGSKIPFIMFTGKGREEVAIEALNKGANHYLQKGGDVNSMYGTLAHAIKEEVEKKRTKEELERLLEFNTDILELSPTGIMKLDKELKVEYENRAMKDILGVPHGEESRALGTDIRELPSVKEAGLSSIFDSLSKGERIFDEALFTSIYKKETYISVIGAPIIKNGEFGGAIIVVQDITERKRAEMEIREKQRLVESVIQNSAIAAFVIDSKHEVIHWNKACEELTGINAEEVLGTDLHGQAFYGHKRPCVADIVIDGKFEDMHTWYKKYAKSNLVPNGIHAEGWYLRLGDRERYIIFDAAPIYNTKGELIAAIETLLDITEQKRMEEALEHRILALTQPEVELGELKLTDVIDLEILQKLQDNFAERNNVASVIFDNNGEPVTAYSNFSEFCKIIRSTPKGLESCKKSDAGLGRKAAQGITGVMPCGNFKEIMDGAFSITIQGQHIANWGVGQVVISDVDEINVREFAREIGADEEELVKASKKLVKKSKEEFEEVIPFLDVIVQQVSLLGLQNLQQARYITERKQLVKKLEDSRKFLESIIENIPDTVTLKDSDYRFVLVNSAYCNNTGVTKAEVIGKTVFREKDKEVFQTGKGLDIQERTYTDIEGNQHYISVKKAPLIDKSGQISHVLSISRDITDRKRAEEALRASEKQLRATKNYLDNVIKSSADTITVVDMKGIVLDWNKGAEGIMGYRADEVIGKSNRKFFADSEEADRIMDRVQKEGEINNYRTIVLKKDGTPVHISMSAALLRDKNGVPVSTVRVSRDITKEVVLAEQIKKERDNLNLIFESMADGVYIISNDYELKFMNKVLIDEFGDHTGSICYKVFHNREEPCPLCKNTEVMKGKCVRWEWNSRRMNKTYDLIETPLTDIDGTISKLTIFRDITERKRAQEEQQEYMAELEQFNRLAVDRELRMIELKQEVNRLCERLGKKPQYNLSFADVKSNGNYE